MDTIFRYAKKRVLNIIVLFFPYVVFAQTGQYRATIQVSNISNIPGNNYNSGCLSEFTVFFKYSNTSADQEIWRVQGIIDRGQTFFEKTVYFPVTQSLTYFFINGHREWKNVGGCTATASDGTKQYITLPCYNTQFTNYIPKWNSTVLVTIRPDTIVLSSQNNLDNVLPTVDKVTINATTGFPANVYNWEFSADNGGTWLPFPSSLQGRDFVYMSANDLFAGSGLNPDNYINRNIQIRVSPCPGSNVSNIVLLNVRKSPPRITSVATTPSDCFDSDNGTIKLSFDRALIPQEKIQFNLVNANDPSLLYDFTTDTLGDNNIFNIPLNLPPATYILKYNTRTFTPTGAESWSNIITSNAITTTAPNVVVFTNSKTDVWCYGGSDGAIALNATGGVGNYQYMIKNQGDPDSLWYNFSSPATHNITGLIKGNYEIQVRDGNQCPAKTAAYGSIISLPVTINQPAAPLQINEAQKVNPTAFGFSNGYFVVDVVGGTPNTDGSYNYQVKNLNGTVITNGITTNVVGSGYKIKVDGLADGTYVLNTDDHNRASATTAQGCMATDTIIITQPQPLIVKFEITDSVLCKNDANGTLAVHATGGISFALPALPYQYTWKKKDAGGVYQAMTTYTDSIASGLTTGWYAVNITDANNISLGTDSVFFLPEPTELLVNLSKVDVTCSGLPNGKIFSTVMGGTQPYSYSWNTGDETTLISGVPAGKYFVWVEDYHDCQIQQSIAINQPNDIQLQVTKKDPTCNNGTDGMINIAINGGTTPFTYNWIGASSSSNAASNLKSGIYTVKITDANGCNLQETDTLINPAPIPLDLGPDRYICSAQQIDYDISLKGEGAYTYNWASNIGFVSSSPNVTLTNAGTYYATIKGANNCTATDMLVLTAINTQVSNEFALPTQGYTGEKIVIANLTLLKADSVQWSLPSKATIISQTDQMVEMVLQDTGLYNVSLRTFKGLCYADQIKKIIINKLTNFPDPGSTRNPFIVDFSAAPIPSNGSFTVYVTLQSVSQMELKLINVITSQITSISKQSGSDKYTIPINLPLTAGTYVLLLETPKGREIIKLLIL